MNMFEIFKTVLQDGMEIDNFRELSNKYKFTLKYQGMGYACVLEKSCTPGHEKEFCKRIINGAVGSMYLNLGNKKEAVAWLNGERWNIVEETKDQSEAKMVIEKLRNAISDYLNDKETTFEMEEAIDAAIEFIQRYHINEDD